MRLRGGERDCAICTQYKTNVFAYEGSRNIQKSSVERHESAEHCAAQRLNDSDHEYNYCFV